jgi:tetratricopeptide (TPR) repeat protein
MNGEKKYGGIIMTSEKLFVQKKYYQTLIEQETDFPVRALGEAYYREQQKDVPDLTSIRYAQGEVYFLYKDFETAIFKWESIQNELAPWAKKNIGDAYLELQQFSTAEEIYKRVNTESIVLHTEISLQLFRLYVKDGRTKEATSIISDIINSNPDYPGVTELARLFFEEIEDWANAIHLAIQEFMRTNSPEWIDVIKKYSDDKRTTIFKPEEYTTFLTYLLSLDRIRFEKMVFKLWENYEDQPELLDWVHTLNNLLIQSELPEQFSWKLLSQQYLKTFQQLLNGKYSLQDIQALIPILLRNWLRFADSNHFVFTACAALAWNEVFPATMDEATVTEAQNAIAHSSNSLVDVHQTKQLFESIVSWSEAADLPVSNKLKWIMENLQNKQSHMTLLTGTSKLQATILGDILRSEQGNQLASKLTLYSYMPESEMVEVNSVESKKVDSPTDISSHDHYIHFKGPFDLLKETNTSLISIPPYRGTVQERSSLSVNIHMTDSIVFVLNEENPLNEMEVNLLKQMKLQAPEHRFIFILPITKEAEEETGVSYYVETVKKNIQALFTHHEIFPYTASQTMDWSHVLNNVNHEGITNARTKKELYFIKETLHYLLAKRADKEEKLIEVIQWNKEMLAKVSGASMQLGDLELEVGDKLKKNYLSILNELSAEVETEIPHVLKKTAESITDESNLATIHLQLNQEMNRRIEDYLQNTTLPKLYSSLQKWIGFTKEELQQIRAYLDEMATSFNGLYGIEKFQFPVDDQLLHDWRRDTGRLTSGVQLEEINIMLKHNPTQLLLKSAGKLFAGIGQNKAKLQEKYKRYVEMEDYSEVAQLVSKQFFAPYQFFAMAIQRDLETFFQKPKDELTRTAEELVSKIGQYEQSLTKLQQNPEAFEDPIKLFTVRFKQYEYLFTGLTKVKHEV